jgi:hypothetical protein
LKRSAETEFYKVSKAVAQVFGFDALEHLIYERVLEEQACFTLCDTTLTHVKKRVFIEFSDG